MATHGCLACNYVMVPVYRAFCEECFGRVPWKLRADVMDAYRKRLTRRAEFDERMAELRTYLRGEQQL